MNFLESLAKQFAGKPIDWDELEETLIRADLGVPMFRQISKVTATSAAPARAASRVASLSKVSLEPTWMSIGGKPLKSA